MVANVETMAYAGQKPWHGLGHKVTSGRWLKAWAGHTFKSNRWWRMGLSPAKASSPASG